MELRDKVYVKVNVDFDFNGSITPNYITWADGRVFEVDRILDVREAASHRAGGQGTRYTCRIQNKERYLFQESLDGRWFVEAYRK